MIHYNFTNEFRSTLYYQIENCFFHLREVKMAFFTMDRDEHITSRFTIVRDGPVAPNACNRVGSPKILDDVISSPDSNLAFIFV